MRLERPSQAGLGVYDSNWQEELKSGGTRINTMETLKLGGEVVWERKVNI